MAGSEEASGSSDATGSAATACPASTTGTWCGCTAASSSGTSHSQQSLQQPQRGQRWLSQASLVQKAQIFKDSCSQMLHANGMGYSPTSAAAVAITFGGSAALPDRPRGTPAPGRWRDPKCTVADGLCSPCFRPWPHSACRPWADWRTCASL